MYKSLRAQTGKGIKTQTYKGTEYLVIPVIAMVEGVRFGANQDSAELGLSSEFGKFPDGWNGRPVVMNHPKMDDNYVSAAIPTVMEEYEFGMIFHTKLDGKKLKMEAWLDTTAKDKSDLIKRVFERVQNDEVVEVSVGFFTDVEEANGKYDGKSYTGVWRNIVPDHLAFLEEGVKGACSVEDGCGSPRTQNVKGQNMPKMGSIAELASKMKKKGTKAKTQESENDDQKTAHSCDCQNKGTLPSVQTLKTQNDEQITIPANAAEAIYHFITQTVPDTLMSGDVIRALSDAIREVHSYAYVVGYTSTHAIYEAYSDEVGSWRLFRQAFDMTDDGEVSLTSDPEMIRLISRIVPITKGTEVKANNSNSNPDEPKEDEMSTENKTNTPTADKVEDKANEQKTEQTSTENLENAEKVKSPGNQPATNAAKPLTAQEYIAAAPDGIREMLETSLKAQEDRKATIIQSIKDSGRNSFDDAYLKAQSIGTLEGLAKLANVSDYSGRALPQPNTQSKSEDSAFAPEAPKVFAKKTA